MVPVYVIRVAGRCAKGGCFNWAQHLRDEFLSNVCESQEQGKASCYSWLLFLIALIAWEAPKESSPCSIWACVKELGTLTYGIPKMHSDWRITKSFGLFSRVM